jgi:hypothetical protein
MHTIQTTRRFACGLWIVLLLSVFASVAVAQSTDLAWPSPIRSNEIRGSIQARDLGDPRVTDHYYAFTGTPGDVLITIDSRNLDGDIDVFTFSGLRPLLKFTVYAGSSSAITKSIYLRSQEQLILRVEGRTPNDDEAAYRLHFGGAFEPITAGPLAEHEDAAQPATTAEVSRKGGRRVTATGARIDEPPSEVAEAPKPEPTPVASESEPKKVVTKPTARNSRPGRPGVRRTRPAATPKVKPEETATKDETTAEGEGEKKSTAEDAEAPRAKPEKPLKKARGARAAAKSPTVKAPATDAQEADDSGPRLIIETSDGTLINRGMGGVRRVTVENGQVVVVGKDGKIQRIPLASVVRMTIAP